MTETTVFPTTPLLRPAQLEEARSEVRSIEEKIKDPRSGLEDRGAAASQLRRMSKALNDQTPRPPVDGAEEGRMVARSKVLLGEILEGMPSQEEMRKAPPGAVDKHMKWEARNKARIQEWKNLQLRLTHATEPEAANLERHRPTGSTLNMDNAFITGKQYFMPPAGVAPIVTFNEEEIAFLKDVSPDLADKLALLGNEDRAQVKAALQAKG